VPRVLLALLLALAVTTPARADTGLTESVAASWFPRTVDAGLHAIAHERVAEISACEDCFDHGEMRPGTGEVLGYNAGFTDAIARVVLGWQNSAGHNALLSDTDYGRIGCAERVVGDRHYFACVLALGPLPAPVAPPPPPPPSEAAPFLLPDTALRAP
jgi:hypothetical protein